MSERERLFQIYRQEANMNGGLKIGGCDNRGAGKSMKLKKPKANGVKGGAVKNVKSKKCVEYYSDSTKTIYQLPADARCTSTQTVMRTKRVGERPKSDWNIFVGWRYHDLKGNFPGLKIYEVASNSGVKADYQNWKANGAPKDANGNPIV